MEQPKGTFTIAEAADRWIAMIESPETKATQEQKAAMIAQIRAAAPTAKVLGVGYPDGVPVNMGVLFVDACNAIKKVIREAK
jgi:hypothetical protein